MVQHVTVLQMQRIENSANPVITRMVVATRRLNVVESPPAEAIAAIEENREGRPARVVGASRRWSAR